MTWSAPTRSRPSRPALLSMINGDASTIRLAGTVPDLRQVLDRLLAGRHLRQEGCVRELNPAQTRDLGALALRDPTLAIPLGRGMGRLESLPSTSYELTIRN